MKKAQAFALFLCITFLALADDVEGFWTTLNEDTGKPSSLIAIYPYEGNYYGRIIATYNKKGVMDDSIYHPKDRAPKIEGHPYYSGLDIVWNMKPKKSGKCKGFIIDPTKGNTYRAEIWRDGINLILRGKLFIFGKNITWPPFPESGFTEEFKKPDLSTFIPKEPITI
jgi:uncharacterized protein (DUF2147 family)